MDWARLRRDPWRTRLLLGLGLLLALVLAYWAKWPCVAPGLGWSQDRPWCYTDMPSQYGSRDFDKSGLPYWDFRENLNATDESDRYVHESEYPVLTGLTQWVASRNTHTASDFFAKNAVLLGLAAFVTLGLMISMDRPARQIIRFVAAPSLVWAAFHNWDLLPLLFVTLTFWGLERGRPALAGAALALGATAKIWPGFLAPVLLVYYLRHGNHRFRNAADYAAGGVLTALAVNGPFILHNFDGWWWSFTFHLDRGITFESVWYAGEMYLRKWGWITIPDATPFYRTQLSLLGLAVLLIPLARLWFRRTGVHQAAWETLLLFLLTSKVMSVQYELWLLPFFVLLNLPWRQYVAIEVASLLVYLTIFHYFFDPLISSNHVWDSQAFRLLAAATLFRHAVLVGLLVASWTRRYDLGRTSADPLVDEEPRKEPSVAA